MSDEVGKTTQAPGTPTAAQREENNQIMKQQEAKAKSKFGNLKKKGPLKNRAYFDSADHFRGQNTGHFQAKDVRSPQLSGVDEEGTTTKK
jgi:hypothetical protein